MRRGEAIFGALATIAGCGASALLLGGCGSCDATVRVTAMPVVAAGTFDGVDIDQASHRLYMANATSQGVDVVDLGGPTPRYVQTVALGAVPNGLAVAADQGRVYVGLADGAVGVIDTSPGSRNYLKQVAKVVVDGASADLMDYSAATRRLFVSSARGGTVVALDTLTDRVAARYFVGEPLEQPRYDAADGKLYVTAPASGALYQIDPGSGRAVQRAVISGCGASGLAINPSRQLAMIACSGSLALFDLTSGKHSVIRSLEGGDLVGYDAQADRFLVASPHGGRDSKVGVFYGDGTLLGSVAAAPKAHAAALDDANGLVYAPGTAGVIAFAPAVCAPPPDWLNVAMGMGVFVVPLLAVALVLVLYARSRDRTRELERGGHQLSPWRVRQQHVAAERDRMRALEDAILGQAPDEPTTS